MSRLPVVLWLVIHAAKSVGWSVEWSLHSNTVTVTEDRPQMVHKPRRWRLIAEELP